MNAFINLFVDLYFKNKPVILNLNMTLHIKKKIKVFYEIFSIIKSNFNLNITRTLFYLYKDTYDAMIIKQKSFY